VRLEDHVLALIGAGRFDFAKKPAGGRIALKIRRPGEYHDKNVSVISDKPATKDRN
jgi:hypothetical protein